MMDVQVQVFHCKPFFSTNKKALNIHSLEYSDMIIFSRTLVKYLSYAAQSKSEPHARCLRNKKVLRRAVFQLGAEYRLYRSVSSIRLSAASVPCLIQTMPPVLHMKGQQQDKVSELET
jgi:hypothetical protein